MADKNIQSLANFVGSLLESLPLHERGCAIREIRLLEEGYWSSLEGRLGDNSQLTLQFLRIEQLKMVPRLNVETTRRYSNVPRNYGQAMNNFLICLPLQLRLQALKKINAIVSMFAIESRIPKTKS